MYQQRRSYCNFNGLYLIERVNNWDVELQKTLYFVSEMEKISGVKQVGVRPKEHDLVRFETPFFHRIADKHPRKGFYLYEELKKRNIVGIKRGQTQWFKCSVYGFSQEQVHYIANSFAEIASKFREMVD